MKPEGCTLDVGNKVVMLILARRIRPNEDMILVMANGSSVWIYTSTLEHSGIKVNGVTL